MATAGRSVMGVIKNPGPGSGISDADREYAAKAMGGQTTFNKESINRPGYSTAGRDSWRGDAERASGSSGEGRGAVCVCLQDPALQR